MSTRKLQQEFDKLQKKVTEGLQQFEEIYEKIGVTENPSLKDKLEGDLRKEIKKLQRLRDQVKQWLGDSSNKLDKSVLLDTRSRIENAMERFKEVEKVSKMKQFSNEGLELQTKLGARGLDEAKKNEASKYIIDILEELNRQNELLSGEMAHYSHKKKLAAAQLALADLNTKYERNNAHILKLELVLRNLENYQLEPEKIDEIKDDLEYYVENNQASDFVEYDEFYEVLELDELLDILPTLAPVGAGVDLQPQAQPQTPSQTQPQTQQNSQQTSKANALLHQPLTPSPKKASASTEPPKKLADLKSHRNLDQRLKTTITTGSSVNSPSSSHAQAPASAPSPTVNSNNTSASTRMNTNANGSAKGSANAGANVPPSSAPAASTDSRSASSSSRAPPPGLNQSKPSTPVQAQAKLTVAEELKRKALTHAAVAAKSPAPKQAQTTASAATSAPSSPVQVPSSAVGASTNASADANANPTADSQAKDASSLVLPLPVLPRAREVKLPFWDNSANVAALAHSRLSNPLPFQAISQQLEASLLNCPDSFDLERPRQYNPTNVHPSSVDYPQEPMFELNSATIMQKFDTDTLFFCFYYNENQDALSKWNAARELSRRGWVFNLQTKQWFSKEDRPKSRSVLAGLQNGDMESSAASYKYFDYENSWLVRRKDNFIFDGELQRTF